MSQGRICLPPYKSCSLIRTAARCECNLANHLLCYASVHLWPGVVILIPCVLNPMLFCYCDDTSPLARLNDCGMLATRLTHKGDHRLGLSWGREIRPCQAFALRHVTSTPLRICPIFPKQHCRRESVRLSFTNSYRLIYLALSSPESRTARGKNCSFM